MARELWACRDVQVWAKSLRNVPLARISVKSKTLADLDRWYCEDLPVSIHARAPPSMTRDELVKLVEWKLARGKWRPRLLDYAKQQDEEQVVQASCAAFQVLNGVTVGQVEPLGVALDHLTALKGVGPATASAILASVTDHAPFMSDEALEAAVGKRDYTRKAYLALAKAIQGQAQLLNSLASVASALPEGQAKVDGPATNTENGQADGSPAADLHEGEHGQQHGQQQASRSCQEGGAAQAPAPGSCQEGGAALAPMMSSPGPAAWTARLVEQALWVAAVLGVPSGDDAAAAQGGTEPRPEVSGKGSARKRPGSGGAGRRRAGALAEQDGEAAAAPTLARKRAKKG